jgi:hypothetical protein
MLPYQFSEEAAAEKYATGCGRAFGVTCVAKWAEIKIHADPLYQHLIVHSGAAIFGVVS